MKYDAWARKLKVYRLQAGYDGGKQLAIDLQLNGLDISYDLIKRYESGNAPSKRQRHLELIDFFAHAGVIDSRLEASEWLRSGGQAGLDPFECRDIFPGQSITLHVKGNLADVDPEQVKRLLNLLAKELDVATEDIELEGMQSGSIKLLLHMPVKAAQKLLLLAQQKSPFFTEHDIFAVSNGEEAIIVNEQAMGLITDRDLLQQAYELAAKADDAQLVQLITRRLDQLPKQDKSGVNTSSWIERFKSWWGAQLGERSAAETNQRPRNRFALVTEVAVVLILLLVGFFIISNFINSPEAPLSETIVEETSTPSPTLVPVETELPLPTVAAPALNCNQDDDGDGIGNCTEEERGTDPANPDTDGDGLADGDEINLLGTNPLNRDTDGDGLDDGLESTNTCLDPLNQDSDGDGIFDADETDACDGSTRSNNTFSFGGQVQSYDEATAEIMSQAGMIWVKTQVLYTMGMDPVSVAAEINQWKQADFLVLINVVGTAEEVGSDEYTAAFAEFVAQLVLLSEADAVEIWNHPNIAASWPQGELDPAGYAQLFNTTAQNIREVRPATLLISAALAPNGAPASEFSWPDDDYLRRMLAAGLAADCIGVEHVSGATAPNQTTGHPSGSDHYSYYWRGMVDRYWSVVNPAGSSPANETPLCFTSLGYLTDEGLESNVTDSPVDFSWAQETSLDDQGTWLNDALVRSCTEGQVKLAIIWNVNFSGELTEDPSSGYALIRPNGDCPACAQLANTAIELAENACFP